MLMWGHNVMMGSYVMFMHVITLRHDVIYDIIQHVLRAYNRPGTAVIVGEFLVQLSMGKEVHMHA